MVSCPAISAIVWAILMILKYDRAESDKRDTACLRSCSAERESTQYFLTSADVISPFRLMRAPAKRLLWRRTAFSTRERTFSLDSPVSFPVSLSSSTGGTSRCMSIRSSKGPEMRFLYLEICHSVHWHAFLGCPKNPQGQGLEAERRRNRAGNVTLPRARVTVTTPSSKGCRNASRTERGNSGNSSKNKTPRWASEISPGTNVGPPPTSPTREIV